MAKAVEPVVTEIPGERRRNPHYDASRRGIEPRQRHVDQLPGHPDPGSQAIQKEDVRLCLVLESLLELLT